MAKSKKDNIDFITIFNPDGISSQNYRKEYPDLYNIPEFEDINDVELITVWYFANPTSPLVESVKDKRLRMQKSHFKATDGYSAERSDHYAEDYINGALPNHDKIKSAIDRMSAMNPHVRTQASRMVEKMLSDFMDILQKDITEFKKGADGDIDFNAYILVRKRVMENLDVIIQKSESGFGTKKVSDKRTSVGENITELYLKKKANVGNT